MALTTEEIFAACDRIDADGKLPSCRNVREELGRGSYTTIADALDQWKVMRRRGNDYPTPEPLSEETRAYLQRALEDMWRHAVEVADGRLEAHRKACQEAITERDARIKEMQEFADLVTAEQERSSEKLLEANAALQQAAVERERLNGALTECRVEIAGYESRIREMAERVDDLKLENERLTEQNALLIGRREE